MHRRGLISGLAGGLGVFGAAAAAGRRPAPSAVPGVPAPLPLPPPLHSGSRLVAVAPGTWWETGSGGQAVAASLRRGRLDPGSTFRSDGSLALVFRCRCVAAGPVGEGLGRSSHGRRALRGGRLGQRPHSGSRLASFRPSALAGGVLRCQRAAPGPGQGRSWRSGPRHYER